MSRVIPTIIMIALAVAFLVHFALIVRYGGYFIQEPNTVILIAEIVLLLAIVGYGIYSLIRVMRR